jgi:hypothetical protein
MSVDYPGAIDMLLPDSYSFNSLDHLVIVNHCTGGDQTLEAIHATFLATMRSTHFGINYNGDVAQFVPLARGAGGNCCPDSTHLPFWDKYIPTYPNLNLCTISIEHCNNSSQSLQMTAPQLYSSKKLNLWLCQRYNIPPGNIMYHSSIDATNCPGSLFMSTAYPEIVAYVTSQGGQPQNMFSNALCVAVWNSFFNSQGMTVPRRDTGIFNDWRTHWINGDFKGTVISEEYPIVLPNGDPGVAQDFAGGTCTWDNTNGTATWI